MDGERESNLSLGPETHSRRFLRPIRGRHRDPPSNRTAPRPGPTVLEGR